MRNTQIQKVPFHGTTLYTTKVDDEGMVVLKPTLEGIGLGYSAQLKKLRDADWAVVSMIATTGADGKTYQMAAVDLDTWSMLLANINAKKVKPELQPIVRTYQKFSAKALRQFWTEGSAVNPSITDPQINRLEEKILALRAARMIEAMDYKSVIALIATKDADGTDYGTIQNNFYLHLFGMTAKRIVKTRPQLQGDRYKVGPRRGALRPSTIAKNYLTEQELSLLAEAVGMFQKVAEFASFSRDLTLDDIKRLSVEVAQKIAAKHRTVRALAA